MDTYLVACLVPTRWDPSLAKSPSVPILAQLGNGLVSLSRPSHSPNWERASEGHARAILPPTQNVTSISKGSLSPPSAPLLLLLSALLPNLLLLLLPLYEIKPSSTRARFNPAVVVIQQSHTYHPYIQAGFSPPPLEIIETAYTSYLTKTGRFHPPNYLRHVSSHHYGLTY